MMIHNYHSLTEGIKDFQNNITGNEEEVIKNVTTEFVKFNEVNVPVDTGALQRSIPMKTDYERGIVIASTVDTGREYAVFAYKHNVTGVVEFFEYTEQQHHDELIKVIEETINRNL